MTRRGRIRSRDLEDLLYRIAPQAAKDAILFSVGPDQVSLPPWYPPILLDDETLEEFTEEVLRRGKPEFPALLARPLGEDRYQLIAGNRWLEAARRIGYETILVRALDIDEPTAVAITLTDALARDRLTPWEEAQGLAELEETLDQLGQPVDVERLETLMGHPPDWIRSRLAIARRLTPAVVRRAGVGIHDLNVIPEDALLHAAEAESPDERAERLREAHQRTSAPPSRLPEDGSSSDLSRKETS